MNIGPLIIELATALHGISIIIMYRVLAKDVRLYIFCYSKFFIIFIHSTFQRLSAILTHVSGHGIYNNSKAKE